MIGHDNTTGTPIPAVVIGGIGIVRALGEEGVPVFAGSDIRRNHILYSRYVTRRVYFSDFNGVEFVNELIRLSKAEGRKLMFFSDDDRAILTFSLHQESLRPYYYINMPPGEVVDCILDKAKFSERAQELDLPVPWSLAPKSYEDLTNLIDKITFPCIIKPAHKDDWWNPKFAQLIGPYRKVIECRSLEELMGYYPKIHEINPNIILQELIEGDDSHLYSTNMYFDSTGTLRGHYVAHKYRTYPIHAGQGSYLATEKREDVLSESVIAAKKLNIRGLCNIQYKRAPNGRLKIMEIHVRNSVWSYVGKASGMNLYYYAYLDQQGADFSFPTDYETGVKFIDLKRDIKALLAYRKTGEWTLMNGLKSWRGKRVYHILSWSDPLPFLADLWFEFIGRLRSGRKTEANAPTPGKNGASHVSTGHNEAIETTG